MNEVLLLVGIVIMICILLGRFAENLPVPSLLIFIGLGMFFGANGPIGIQFDDYSVSESICTICLIFIMFYGALAPILLPPGLFWENLSVYLPWGLFLPPALPELLYISFSVYPGRKVSLSEA